MYKWLFCGLAGWIALSVVVKISDNNQGEIFRLMDMIQVEGKYVTLKKNIVARCPSDMFDDIRTDGRVSMVDIPKGYKLHMTNSINDDHIAINVEEK